jgi:glycosyltransferase involved in cell wall biosynthesis
MAGEMHTRDVAVSVVMPTIDFAGTFETCARRALDLMDASPLACELVVALDGPEQPRPTWLERPGVTVIATGRRSGPAVARNRAASAARGGTLLFVDADVALAEGTIERAHEALGGQVMLEARVVELRHDRGRVTSVLVEQAGQRHEMRCESVISSMPLSALIKGLGPEVPASVQAAASGLRYRDFLIVALTCRKANVFPDNWVYIHSPQARVGRIQNFRNWSPDMVAPGIGTTLGMEYFCSRGDDLWSMDDAELIDLARRELAALGLVDLADIGNEGLVIRELNAYPVYDSSYRQHVDALRAYLRGFSNLHTVGRNGMHRYNNQDHSMLAGRHAAMQMIGRPELDPWEVNTERSYYEEQVLTPDKRHSAVEILVADKAPPHPRRMHARFAALRRAKRA